MALGRAFINDREWRIFIKETSSNLSKSNNILKAAYATIGFRDILRHFKSEKGESGKQWEPLKASTLAARTKGRKRRSPKILQDTGNLRQSFLPTNVKRVGRDAVLVFNNATYSGIHDRGSSKNNIPKRDFMYLTEQAQDAMAKMILNRIAR